MASAGDVGLAFGLVIAAGLCTCLGACMAFFVKLTDYRVLSAALGVSAGVMVYVSFVEIFSSKSIQGFVDAGYSENHAFRYSTLMFFGGMLFTWILNQVAHFILHLSDRCGSHSRDQEAEPCTQAARQAMAQSDDSSISDTGPVNPLDAPLEQVLPLDVEAARSPPYRHVGALDEHNRAGDTPSRPEMQQQQQQQQPAPPAGLLPPEEPQSEVVVEMLKADHHSHLTRMGLLSGLAVGIHNFPEGLATFVGTLADPRAGVAIAVAIALHNIPEGIVVAMPIYYATGSKWKGFLWSAVCGMAEPVAGLVGWLILRGRDSDPLMYAVMFAIVAGMMVYISLVELLPTALRYDKDNRLTTRGLVAGMVLMAASLLLFRV